MRIQHVLLTRHDKTCSFFYTLENGHLYEIHEEMDFLGCHSHCHSAVSVDKEFQFLELVSATLWLILGGLKDQQFYRNMILEYEGVFKGNKEIKAETVWTVSTMLSLGILENKHLTEEQVHDKFTREQGYMLSNMRDIQEKVNG